MIRQAAPGDMPAIASLYAEGSARFAGAPAIFHSRGLEELEADVGTDRMIVAVDDDDRVIGFNRILVSGERMYGLNICVNTEARGKGVGAALIRAGHAIARDKGATASICTIWEPTGLKAFYEANGYQVIGTLMEAAL